MLKLSSNLSDAQNFFDYVTVTDLNLNVYSESKDSMENFQGIGE